MKQKFLEGAQETIHSGYLQGGGAGDAPFEITLVCHLKTFLNHVHELHL